MAHETFEVAFRKKQFNLRALIGALTVRQGCEGTVLEATLLRNERGRIGRPDVLLEALELSAHARSVHRTEIVFDQSMSTSS
jgi:hypothetical protein